jgi:hypothetical protein
MCMWKECGRVLPVTDHRILSVKIIRKIYDKYCIKIYFRLNTWVFSSDLQIQQLSSHLLPVSVWDQRWKSTNKSPFLSDLSNLEFFYLFTAVLSLSFISQFRTREHGQSWLRTAQDFSTEFHKCQSYSFGKTKSVTVTRTVRFLNIVTETSSVFPVDCKARS